MCMQHINAWYLITVFVYVVWLYMHSYTAGCEWSEFGEASPVHMLTGWLPHTIAIK